MKLALAILALLLWTPCHASAADISLDQAQRTRLVGSTIIAGFFGSDRADPRFRAIIDNLETGTIGGVLFLARNITSRPALQAMVDDVRRCRCNSLPLIAVDEEGGIVQRLGAKVGFDDIPSAEAVGRMSRPEAARIYGRLARKLGALGFNLNLGPVVDLNTDPDSPAIGRLHRSFSANPRKVSAYAALFVAAHRSNGIATALKHFPGHGSARADSHDEVARVDTSWSNDELVPYRRLIGKNAVDAIMVGHLANQRQWGGTATQDGADAIRRMLRRELGFVGVVVSDDLSMHAVAGERGLADAIRSAVRAGVDIVIATRLSDDDETADVGQIAHAAILAGIASGEIDWTTIERAGRRIERLKSRIGRKAGLAD